MHSFLTTSSQRTGLHCLRRWFSKVVRLLPLLMLLAFSAVAYAQTTTGTTVDGLKYAITNNQVSITGYSGTGGVVSISGTISGLPVTSIGTAAFGGCTSLTSVTIPNSVTSIGDSAFAVCSNLTTVTIPSRVTSIGNCAFLGCSHLQNAIFVGNAPSMGVSVFPTNSSPTGVCTVIYLKGATGFTLSPWSGYPTACLTYTTSNNQVTITSGSGSVTCIGIPGMIDGLPVTTIGSNAFYFRTKLISVTIPNSVTSIEGLAFAGCTSLTSVTIPNSVTSIGISAFAGCYYLTSVTIPNSVTSIGTAAFGSCGLLTSITVDAQNPFYCSVDGILFDKSQNTLVQYPAGKSGSYTIPNSVTSIGISAFAWCGNLSSVAIPSSVTSIGVYAFTGCNHLTSITVDAQNSAYSSIDGVLFNKSQSMLIQYPGRKSGGYTIPNSVTSIGISAFAWCGSLSRVTIPNGVTGIGSNAFSWSSSLGSVTIPSSVTSIGTNAFYYCGSLKRAVFMGDAPALGSTVFDSAASGFTVYYFNDKTGFTSSTWNGYTAVNMGNFSPVPPWLLLKGLPYNADLQSTPNHDGVSLLTAYALNLDPNRNQSGSLPRPVVSADQMCLTFYAGSAGVTYTAESSTDLQTWSTAEVSVSAPDANNFRTATVPTTGPRRFMRLVVSH